MPYPNEHAATLRDSEEFNAETFRRVAGGKLYGRIEVPATINVVWGKLKTADSAEDPPIAQGLRFPTKDWTEEQARGWVSDNKIKIVEFEPASRPTGDQDQANAAFAIELVSQPDGVKITAAAGGDHTKLPRLEILAYAGGVMRIEDLPLPIVMDIGGIDLPAGLPVLADHKIDKPIGHGVPAIADGKLIVSGVVSIDSVTSRAFLTAARNGFPWQASVGAEMLERELYRSGETFTANGQSFTAGALGLLRVTRSRLREVSVLSIGADASTRVNVAARGRGALENKNMPKTQTENEIRTAERERIQQIETVCSQFPQFQTDELQASAIAETITFEALQAGLLAQVRSHRPAGLAASGGLVDPLGSLGMDTRGGEIPGLKIIEAAACITTIGDGKNVTEMYDEQTLDAADNLRGMGIQEMIECAANLSGVDLPRFRNQPQAWLRAAFSTMSVPVILSNVANKVLVASFSSVENTWRAIAKISALKDFKQSPRYRLTGDLKYELVSPDGELQHASLGEEGYNLKADTRGKMLTITRQDIINDDLGAFAQLPGALGRGSGLSLNEVFWTIFLANADFFKTANKNYATGAGTALDIDSLTQAEQIFLDQVDKAGHPIGIPPKTLLVPTDLAAISSQLCKSLEIRNPGATKQVTIINPHAGKFTAAASTYLKNSNFSGSSLLAWYLTADPNVLPVIEVGFLNGRQTPIIETADADFNTLGISMRGYHDFAVSLADHRGGVKMLGEA